MDVKNTITVILYNKCIECNGFGYIVKWHAPDDREDIKCKKCKGTGIENEHRS